MIVVTGSSGFIGRNLLGPLTMAGHDVVGVDRRPPARPSRHRFVCAELALLDPDVADLLGAAEAVIHLAARPGVRDQSPDVERQRWLDNVVATDRVLTACAPDVYVVVASSSSVYGGARGGRPSHEDDELRPMGGYARSKLATEQRCGRRAGPTLVVRPFTVVGEHQRSDMALSRWIRSAEQGRPLHVFGDPSRSRDLTDVADVVRALTTAIERRPVGTVNIGTGCQRTLAEVVAAVRRNVGDVPIDAVPVPMAEPDTTHADTTRCEQVFGFRPTTDLDAVVRRQHQAMATPPHRPRGSILDDVGAEVLAS